MHTDYTSLITYEDSHIIVCRKPAGLPVQTNRIGAKDLESILKNHLSRSTSTSPYLAVIHRLDQPVEGLLVFAKTPPAAKDLNRQLTSSGFGKYYLAEISGHPHPETGTLEDFLAKDSRTNTSHVCCQGTTGAKKARLHYKIIDQLSASSIAEIRLDTGRHHQIRVQMSHFGHPIIGDRKYGAQDYSGSLHLCACKLEFTHPVTKNKMIFTATPSFLN